MAFIDLRKRFGAAAIFPVFLLFSSVIANAATYSELEPQILIRASGAPLSQTISFAPTNHQPGATFTFIIENGGVGTDGTVLPKISSATITLNGEDIFVPKDFNQKTSRLTKQVVLQAQNTITARLNSKPGGTIRLAIEGEDSIAPTITPRSNPAENLFGWHNSDVEVSFQCADAQSGIASCTDPVSITSDAQGKIVTGTAIDKAGNQASTSVTVNLDKTSPIINIFSPEEGSLIRETRPAIVAQVTDNFSLDENSYSLLINGSVAQADCQLVSDTLSCTPTADLVPGSYDFKMSIADKAGNVSESSLKVEILPVEISRIVVTPGAALLTHVDDSMVLSVGAFDEFGNAIKTGFTWMSLKPEIVSVDKFGRITANALGSAQIVVQAGEKTSAPIVVVVAEPATDVTVINDSQVLSEPMLLKPEPTFYYGLQYQLVISGISLPEIGSLITTNGEKPAAGRVVAAEPVGMNYLVTLEAVPIREFFPYLQMDETIDLTNVESTYPAEVLRDFNIEELPDGTIEFTPKNGEIIYQSASSNYNLLERMASVLKPSNFHLGELLLKPKPAFAADQLGEKSFKVGAFDCKADVDFPVFKLGITSISFKPNASHKVTYDSFTGNYTEISLTARPEFSMTASFIVSTAVKGTVNCKFVVKKIVPKLPGVFFVIAPVIPTGVGFGLDGNVTLTSMSINRTVSAKGYVTGGIKCPPTGIGFDCDGFVNGDGSAEFGELEIVTPGYNNLDEGLRVTANVGLFGFADLEAWPLAKWKIELFQNHIGLKAGVNLATVVGQIADEKYKSDYQAKLEAVVKLGKGVNSVFDLINIDPSIKHEWNLPLAQSPALVAPSPGVKNFKIKRDDTGESFVLDIDPETIYWPRLTNNYNISEIVVYKKTVESGKLVPVLVASQAPTSDGQTNFEIVLDQPIELGEYYAFVITKEREGSILNEYELGSVIDVKNDYLYLHVIENRLSGMSGKRSYVDSMGEDGSIVDRQYSQLKHDAASITVHDGISYGSEFYPTSRLYKNSSSLVDLPWGDHQVASNSQGVFVTTIFDGGDYHTQVSLYSFDGTFQYIWDTGEQGSHVIAANEIGVVTGYYKSAKLFSLTGELIADLGNNYDWALAVAATRDRFYVFDNTQILHVFDLNGNKVNEVSIPVGWGETMAVTENTLYLGNGYGWTDGIVYVYKRDVIRDQDGNITSETFQFVEEKILEDKYLTSISVDSNKLTEPLSQP